MRFITGLIVGIALVQVADSQTVNIVQLRMETQPAPTGTIRHWTVYNMGGTCSADIESPFGKLMDRYDEEDKVLLTIEPYRRIAR